MCLNRSWYPKLMTISKSMDLSSMTTSALFGMLREHEIEMQRLNEKESTEKKGGEYSLEDQHQNQ